MNKIKTNGKFQNLLLKTRTSFLKPNYFGDQIFTDRERKRKPRQIKTTLQKKKFINFKLIQPSKPFLNKIEEIELANVILNQTKTKKNTKTNEKQKENERQKEKEKERRKTNFFQAHKTNSNDNQIEEIQEILVEETFDDPISEFELDSSLQTTPRKTFNKRNLITLARSPQRRLFNFKIEKKKQNSPKKFKSMQHKTKTKSPHQVFQKILNKPICHNFEMTNYKKRDGKKNSKTLGKYASLLQKSMDQLEKPFQLHRKDRLMQRSTAISSSQPSLPTKFSSNNQNDQLIENTACKLYLVVVYIESTPFFGNYLLICYSLNRNSFVQTLIQQTTFEMDRIVPGDQLEIQHYVLNFNGNLRIDGINTVFCLKFEKLQPTELEKNTLIEELQLKNKFSQFFPKFQKERNLKSLLQAPTFCENENKQSNEVKNSPTDKPETNPTETTSKTKNSSFLKLGLFTREVTIKIISKFNLPNTNTPLYLISDLHNTLALIQIPQDFQLETNLSYLLHNVKIINWQINLNSHISRQISKITNQKKLFSSNKILLLKREFDFFLKKFNL
ncbi:hypothetical protein M0813_02433 [Anaeramoeba flamelloides]|uniref:Uncharacterized protein n=1 Tax=Anaeramoeba flamelloides TaxID=1746091 RepID=A0ABQ8YIU7_9EUKA|nr:hypothetical protein M0813_02433 [Anaeramoeba flamelloides]